MQTIMKKSDMFVTFKKGSYVIERHPRANNKLAFIYVVSRDFIKQHLTNKDIGNWKSLPENSVRSLILGCLFCVNESNTSQMVG